MEPTIHPNLLDSKPIEPLDPALKTANTPQNSPPARKLRKATEEFESILMTSWWEQMEKTFGGTEGHEPGHDAIQDMGLRAMTTAMAQAGGFGIARMLYHQLAPELSRTPSTVGQNH